MRNGGVVVDEDGTIVEVVSRGFVDHDIRYDHQILLPGVLNCHVHLTDARREVPVPGGEGLNQWARKLLATRGEESRSPDRDLGDAVADVLRRMREGGTYGIGEVVNNFDTLAPIARSGMRCRLIHELIGFKGELAQTIMERSLTAEAATEWPETVAYGFGVHAPFSVSPWLMQLAAERSGERDLFFYQHLAEDPDERLLYEQGKGPWNNLLHEIGSWDDNWEPPGVSPIEYYDRIGVLNDRFVAVHLADARPDEIDLLARRGVRAILSPTSNLHITGKLPPMEAIVESGMQFALGTDGRGSNPSVDVFSEARILLEHWPDLPAGLILEALTSAGADILQFDDMGRIDREMRPGLVSIEMANASDDMRALEREIIMGAPRRPVAPG